MFFVNDPGPWPSFVLRPDNVGRPINEVTQKYLYEQLQFDNFLSMQQQLQIQQYQNKGFLTETTPPVSYTITFTIDVESDGNYFRFGVDATEDASTDVTIDWGDGSPIESGSVTFPTGENFQYNYPTAGNYTVGITFSEPSSVYAIYADQND